MLVTYLRLDIFVSTAVFISGMHNIIIITNGFIAKFGNVSLLRNNCGYKRGKNS